MQARHVILRVMLEHGDGLVKIHVDHEKKTLLVELDRATIPTKGKKCIEEFLRKIQVYKSTGNFEEGNKMYQRKFIDVPLCPSS